ncbi:MAG: 3-deoxy-manno-octulosonate cytidylyltransferase [Rickettsiales bacterium]
MNPVIIIPARMASTRLPNKPMALVGGLPMIVQVMKRAQAANIGRVVVACDGEEIAGAVRGAGGEAIITDADLPSGSDRIFQALTKIDPEKKHDVIINVQGDMPCLDPEIIGKLFAVLENKEVDIATLAAVITDEAERTDPSVVKVVMGHGSWVMEKKNLPMTHDSGLMTARALYFSRATIPHGKGELYHHIGIYAYRRAALEKFVNLPPSSLEVREKLEQLRALEAGMRIDVAVVDTVPLGVDTQEGLEKARKIYAKCT